MSDMYLFRAFAYQLQSLETFDARVQPEVMVFFEVHHPLAAIATLQRVLALSWGCRPADIEFHGLTDAAELLQQHAEVAPGDAALWVTGNHHGPTFQATDRTLMFVRPSTLRRLAMARQATAPLRALQRAAAHEAGVREQRQQRQRNDFLVDLMASLEKRHTPSFGGWL